MGVGRIKGITIEIGGDTKKLQDSLKGVNTSLKNTQSALKDINRLLKLDPGNTTLLKQKQDELKNSITQTQEKLKQEKEALEQLKKADQTPEVIKQQEALQREIIEDEQKLKSLNNEMKEFGSVGKQQAIAVGEKFKEVGANISAVGDKIAGVGKGLTAKVTAPIVGTFSVATKSAVDFEDAMAKVSTIADTSAVPIGDLEDQIKSLSKETGVAATELADNVYNAISAGQETGDAVNFVAEATKLSVAGFADSGAALDLLTTTLNAYGMEAEEVTHVSDVLINTQNLGKTTVGELASAMGKVIPTAKASNVSLENLAAGYSIMTANGIATAESTTYMNSMLNELSKSGTKASDTIKQKTGKSFQELMEGGSSLADVLSVLQETAEENNLAMGDMFGSAEAGKAALVLLSGGVDEFNSTVESMLGSTGATDAAFEKLQTTSRKAGIAFNQIKISAIELGGAILDVLMPYFEKLTDKISQVTEWFNNLDDSQKQLIVKIGLVAAAIGPALVVIGTLVSTVGKAVSGFGSLQIALAGISAPILAIVAAVGALVAVFVYLFNTNEEFRNSVLEIWGQIQEFIGQVIEQIKTIITSFCDLISLAWATWGDEIMAVVTTVWGYIQTAIEGALTVIQGIINTVMALIKGDWQGVWEGIKQILQGALELIKGIVSASLTVLTSVISAALSAIKTLFSTIWEAIKTKVTEVINAVKSTISTVMETIRTKISTILGTIKSKFSEIWDSIKTIVSTAIETIKTKIINGIETAKTTVSTTLDAIKQKFTDVWDSAKKIVGDAIEAIKGFLNFKWELPKLKMPHFSVSGSANPIDWLTQGVPKLSVEWYKKAYAGAMRFASPTVLPTTNGLKGFGDGNGAEIVVGENSLLSSISRASGGDALVARMDNLTAMLAEYLPEMADTNIYIDKNTLVGAITPAMNRQLGLAYRGTI